MIRVLVTGAENIGITGLATAIFRWGQAFNHDEVVYDYLMLKGLPDEKYQQQINNTGGIIFSNPCMFQKCNLVRSLQWTFRTFGEHKEQILHINASWCYEAFPFVFLARLAGMNRIAVHSHSSYVDSNNPWIRKLKVAAHYFFRPYIASRTRLKLACSLEAAEWMFGKKVVQTNQWKKVCNSVDLARYRFDRASRKKHREALGIEKNELVVGSIGRLSYAKNYEFLMDVMAELIQKKPDCKLLLIGEGGYRSMLESKAKTLGIQKNVIFAGSRPDANEILSAMDVFVLPSRFEGLPLVLIEAQVAQLPCVVSDHVTRECKLTDSMVYMSTEDREGWADTIIELGKKGKELVWIHPVEPYTNTDSARRLKDIYYNFLYEITEKH